MSLSGHLETVLRLALLLSGLLVPGTMLLRALRLPWSLAAAFAVSTASLYGVVLAFTFAGLGISLLSLAAALGLIALGARLVPARPATTQISPSFAMFTRMGWWRPLYFLFWLIVAYRLMLQPLSGPDVHFRWSWLAEQMLASGSLDFYPPRGAGDFARYFWAESIPPGIGSLYAWAYACGGSREGLWTSPVVALQLLAAHELVWRLGSRWGGEIVARRAVLLAAACPLLTWSFLIGQETGLTAVTVLGLLWSLAHWREAEGNRWAVLTGCFAVVAASTREYGPIFPFATLAAAYLLRARVRQFAILAVVTVPIALAWPLRTWLLTGNPVYSLNPGGIFPANALFTAWNDAFRASHGFGLTVPADWLALGRYLLLWALPAVAGVVALLVLSAQRLREAQLFAWWTGLIFALWFASVSFTAGGLFYSLRVLCPAFALLVIPAAYGLGFVLRSPRGIAVGHLVVAALLLEALPKTWVLPENPYRIAVSDWPRAGARFTEEVRGADEALLAKLLTLSDHKIIISDNAGLPHLLSPHGMVVLPLWSPEVAWLFEGTLAPQEVARRWKAAGFHYLVIGKSKATDEFIRTRARWRAPTFTVSVIAETDTYIILEASLAPEPAA